MELNKKDVLSVAGISAIILFINRTINPVLTIVALLTNLIDGLSDNQLVKIMIWTSIILSLSVVIINLLFGIDNAGEEGEFVENESGLDMNRVGLTKYEERN